MAKSRKPKRRIVRLLPVTVTMLSLLFIIKVNELYLDSRDLRAMYSARDAVASSEKKDDKEHAKESEKKEESKDEKHADAKGEKKDEAKADDKHAEGDVKKEGEEKDAKKEDEHGEKKEDGHGAKEEKSEGGHGEKDSKKKPEEEKTFGTGKSTVKDIEAIKAKEAQPRYSQTELDLLQNLSKRRDELDQRQRDFEIKAKVLDATEKRINDKIGEMKLLQTELSKVLAQYNEKQDMQIKSLVKIYENMKPDDAAKIFDEMEMPILLEVIAKMSERKVAPVLANMSPKRARDVTQELAEKRKKAVAAGAATGGAAPGGGAAGAKP